VRHAELLAAAQGDNEALTALVRAYHDRVYRFGRRVCRDGAEADDAVQEAFLTLSRRPDVVGHPGALSWLMTTVRHVCLRMLRPFAQRQRLEHLEVSDEGLDVESALARWELVRAVHEVIAGLEASAREVLVLRDLEGLSGEEVAQSLGVTVPAMKTRLHRARQQVRVALELRLARE
jgi:RNA polymerase sigma-70 factor, ECF subfamily